MVLLPSLIAADSTAAASDVAGLFGSFAFAALFSLTGALAILFAVSARKEPPRIENHWGGFGGSGGGWRMSASMAYLLAALAFGAMFTAVAKDLSRPADSRGKTATAPTTGAASKTDSTSRTGKPSTTDSASTPPATTSHDSTIAPAVVPK